MLINADFSCRAWVLPEQQQWVASPQGGVERIMLDRVGAEKARATSIVRYAPNSFFPQHSHPGGEEVLVLSGVFSEDNDHYPAGWYMRNPPGSRHQPSSLEGAVIFVKLWQMRPTERSFVRVNTNDPNAWQQGADRAECPLFADDIESVRLLRLDAGAVLLPAQVDGAEAFVLKGELTEGAQTYRESAWLRLPAGRYPDIIAGPEGATVYLKTGPHTVVQPA
ncbi:MULTISPECIES: cupin domain-containing protein [unclassified Pusillimonas]|uniref:cupin domain-containing protein n=1 Tax=unclassified Pusillimonas TaxID=2640016 RepID=UPI000B9C8188|nr:MULTISPECIES: cupin domain-containing protein [unclassified Pusillimonas]OXR49580.1 anti-sigma factor [Pusillimonas sp. T2]ROT44367.1 anti-sigma factor [Pusillimonas sp. NJUB218]